MVDGTNTITSGQTGEGSSLNPLEATLPASSGILMRVQLLGILVGIADALLDPLLKRVSAWKVDNVTSGTAAATPLGLVAPTAADPLLLRITSPNDGSDVLGNTQVQSTDGAATTALGRFFSRAGMLIHGFGRLKWSANNGATLFGVTNVATGLMAANGTVSGNLTDGIFVYRAPGSGTITGFVRRAGTNSKSVVLTTAAAAATPYEIGFRADQAGVTFSFNGAETGVALATNEWPNAALAATIVQGGNARQLDVQRVFFAQEAV